MSILMASSRPSGTSARQERKVPRASKISFAQDTRGDVAMMFGLMAIMMMLFVGGAVDFGRWLHASKQTKVAIDGAVLAGARVLQTEGTSAAAITKAKATAKRFYDENVKTRLSSVYNDNITFTTTVGATISVTATGNAFIKTPILNVTSLIPGATAITSLPLLRASSADYSVAKLASSGNAQNSVEIGLMLDTSGSMSGTKIADMKLAAKDLIDIVVWDNQGSSQYTSKVAIAPFSADVRLPTQWNDAARGPSPSVVPTSVLGTTYSCSNGNGNKNNSTCADTYLLTSCVVERAGANRYTDAAPGVSNYVTPEYSTDGQCSQPSVNSVMALSNDKVALRAKIDGLVIGGGTAGHLGTAWAWYTISPNWGFVFPSSGQPQPYTTPKLKKIAILMTDGEYNTQYSIKGINSNDRRGGILANDSSINQAKALCDGMKAQGIAVYTVGFDLGGNATAINTLSYCASSTSNFYNATDGAQLRQSFRDIALKISNLYLSK